MVIVVVVSLVGCGDKISAEVRDSVKEFESICDEYCEIAKKVANGDSIEATSDLLAFLPKLSTAQEKVQNLTKKNLSDEEKEYVIESLERCKNKVDEATKMLQ